VKQRVKEIHDTESRRREKQKQKDATRRSEAAAGEVEVFSLHACTGNTCGLAHHRQVYWR